MAIPHPPQQLSGRQRVIVRVSLVVALFSSALAVSLCTGALPVSSPVAQCPPGAAARPTCAPCPPSPTPGAAIEPPASEPRAAAVAPSRLPAAAAALTANDRAEALQRFSICEAASGGEPIVRLLAITPHAAPVVGVHCGNRVELIAFDRGAPRRIATLEAPPPDRNLSDFAGALLAADVSGDGAIDLIVGRHARDEQASPRGGALYEVRRTSSGSFADPRTLAPLSVGAVIALELDDTKGSELAVLQLQDPRLARANEVVLLRGGPSPMKLAALRAGIGMEQIAAVDLDLDTHPDLIIAGHDRPTEILYLDARGTPRRRLSIDSAPAASLSAFDLDRDGHDDLVLAGSGAGVILASHAEPPTPIPLPALSDVEHLQTMDWDSDGKLELIGQRGPALLVLTPNANRELTSREIMTWPDPDFVVRSVVAGPSKGRPGLVLIASPVQARGRVELWLASTLPLRMQSSHLLPVPDAPLVQRLALP